MNANQIKITFFQAHGVFTEIVIDREKMQAQINRFVECKVRAQVYDLTGKIGEVRPSNGKWEYSHD
jgi:hypothetical protein